MAAVISGNGLGLYNSSLNIIGGGTSATIGQQGNQVYLNAATGNLVVRQRDEFVAGQGADFALIRTYNSQGTFDGDNNDNWRLNVYQSLVLSGTANTLGSTITKTYGDGSQSVFNYDTALGYYTSTDGDGAHDTISQSGSNWVWSSGDGTVTETYDVAGQLISAQDADGNTRSYTYTGSLITQITDSSGQTINLVYNGNNLQRVDTISSGITQSRVSYGYDANTPNNRLISVTVDLSPEDNSTVDGNTFTTTYTYDGASTRIASITHSDGATVSFTYDASNRVSTITEGSGADAQTTEYRYDYSTQELTIAANGAVLSTAGSTTQTTTYTLNNGALNRHTLNAGALSTTETVITETPYAMLGTAPITTADPVWTDDFARADGADVSNGWIEKTPGSMSLAAGAVAKQAVSTGYRDNLVYRPSAEDVLDVEASVEFNWSSGATPGYTQVFVRGQASTIATADTMDAYLLYLNNSTGEAILGRQTGSTFVDPLSTITINPVLNQTDTYRLRLSATGTSSVALTANVERWDGSAWVSIGQASYTDTAVNRIDTAGTVGFSGYTEAGYSFDNFTRTPLTVVADHYLVQAGDTWAGIATALYGTADVANELAALYPSLVPTAGDQLFDLPASLNDVQSSVVTVAEHYAIQVGDTWESIAATLYGDANLAAELQTALAYPDLSALSKLEGLPSILVNVNDPATVQQTHTILPGAPLSSGPQTWSDDFTRADNVDVGNGWVEKTPSSISLFNNQAAKLAAATGYKDNLVYRPAAEDVLDVEASVEFTWTSGSIGYPQLFVRGQSSTIASNDTMDAYMLFINNSTSQAVLRRQTGTGFGADLGAPITLSPELVLGQQYRLSLSATGTTSVALNANIEHWNGSAWISVGQLSYTDTAAERIDTAGTVGFSGYTEASYSYDNFNRTPLNADVQYYAVQAGDTWSSIALSLYGTEDVADELAALYPALTPSAGDQLFDLPASLTDTQLVQQPVDDYYLIQSGDTWADIATAVYGNADVANELQAALGDPALAVGTRLSGLPDTIDDVQQVATTVAAYYTVQAGDTWSSIAQGVYGNSQAEVVAALQEALGNPALTTGLQLTVPQTLAYSVLTNEIDTTSVIDPLGRISSYRYDAEGKLTEVLSPALNTGQRLSTRYQYDAVDNLSKVIDGLNNEVNYGYDANGNLISQQDDAGNRVEYTYTASNQLASETIYLSPDPDGTGALVATDPQTTHYIYDAEDHLRFLVSAGGSVTEHRYNADGTRSTTVVYSAEQYSDFTNLTETALSTWAGDAARDLTQTQRTDYAYDFRDQLSSTTTYSSTLSTGAGDTTTASTTHFIYDQAGQLIKTVDPRGAAPTGSAYQAANFETHYVYDGLGRLTQSTDAAGNVTSTLYNDASQRIETTQANGLLRTSVYDTQGRLVSISEYDPADLATPLSDSRHVYDANSRLRAVQDPNGVITHNLYDEAGRLVASIDGIGALTEYLYDANSQLIQQIVYATALDSSALGGLVNVDGSGAIISANEVPLDVIRPAAHADDRSHFQYYDESGQLRFEIDGEGYVTEFRYDGAGQRIDTIQHSAPFPGFINNDEAGARVTLTGTDTLLEWVGNNVAANAQVSASIIDEESGNAISVNLDLASNTGTVETTRTPTQIFESDNYASTDTRTLVTTTESLAVSPGFDTIPPAEPFIADLNESYITSSAESLQLTKSNSYDIGVNGATRSGSTYTVSSIPYNSSDTDWKVNLYKKSGSSWNLHLTRYTTTPSSENFSGLSYGEYRVTTQSHTLYWTPLGGGSWQEGLNAEASPKYFDIYQVTTGSTISLPTAGASSVTFQYRDVAAGGTVYTTDSETDFNIDLPVSETGKTLEFKMTFRDAGGNAIKMAVGQFANSAGSTSNASFNAYGVQSATTGTFLNNALTPSEVGLYGDELQTTLEFVDVNVYDAQSGVLVSTARTYPNLVNEITGNIGVNLSTTAALPAGIYNIELEKHFIGGVVATVPLYGDGINEYQLGDMYKYHQTLSWPASVQLMEQNDTATFYYRKVGDTTFTALNKTVGTGGEPTYFIKNGSNYEVRLYDLENNTNYEYYVEYRAEDQRLLKWTEVNTFNSSGATALAVDFKHNTDTSVSYAGGTRLVGFLPPADILAVDYLSVNVIDDVTSATVHSNVLTIPRVESNYLGALNLTSSSPLADGRYRIQVTRYFKDESITPQVDEFVHEVGLQTTASQALNVTVAGDETTASYTGALGIANGVTLTVNSATGSVSLNADSLNEGSYSYSQRVDDVTAGTYQADTGRLAVYAGGTPDISALQDFYSRERTVSVDVTQGTSTTYRSPELPVGYAYVANSQSVITAQQTELFDLTAANTTTTNSPQVRTDNTIDISATGGVWKVISVINRATNVVVSSEPWPDMSYISSWNADDYLRQGPRDSFNVAHLSAGDYTLKVETVVASYYPGAAAWTPSQWQEWYQTGHTYEQAPVPGEGYSVGPTTSIHFSMGGLPETTAISWDASTHPIGTTYTFQYRPAGSAAYLDPLSLQASGPNLVAGIGNDAEGFYEYRIEYRDAASELVKESTGFFQILAGQSITATNSMTAYFEVSEAIDGSSLISTAHNRTDIQTIEALVYDNVTNALVNTASASSPVITNPTLFSPYIGQINLQDGSPLANGVYRVELKVTYTNSSVVNETPFIIEVGEQPVVEPSTELRWDATNRPQNSDVYFRYKPVAQAKFADNMWIRATASQSIQGEYYVRFPQTTPDGLHQLESLAQGQYDYMVIYVDRDTGKQIEASLGQFDVIHNAGHTSTHQLTFSRDFDGRHSRSFFNEYGQLAGVLDALGYLTENVYDNAGRLVQTIQYATQTHSAEWLQGTLEQLRPDASVDDIHNFIKYNDQGQPVLSVNAEGYVTETIYDVAGNVTQVVEYATATSSIDVLNDSIAAIRPASVATANRITETTYTSLSQVATISNKVGTTTISVTEFEYDVMGNLIRTTAAAASADERTSRNRYDIQGRLVASLTAQGGQALVDLLAANPSATQAEIDAIWQQYAIEYVYDAAGQQIQVIDQNDNAQRYYYDSNGNIRYSINAMGEIQERVYNLFGQVSHVIAYANRADSTFMAELAGGLLAPSVQLIFNILRDPARDSVVKQAYDSRGLLASHSDELGYETTYQYNAFGQVRFENQTLQGGATNGQQYSIERIYDALGRETNTLGLGADGQINRGTDYDIFGRVIAAYGYDQNQNLFEHYINTYDKLGRVTETLEVRDSVAAVTQSINSYTYDAFGRVLTQTDANGQATSYSYNDLTQTVTITTPEGVSSSTTSNAHGETVSVTDGNGQTTIFEYDKNGRLISTTDAESNTVTNQYDAAGRLTFTTDANGAQIQTHYDAANRVIERIVDPTGLNISTKTAYDAQGRVIQSIDPNGVITETYYDQKGQVVAVIIDAVPEVDDGKDHLALTTFYTYDDRGNQLTVSVGNQPGITQQGDSEGALLFDASGNPLQEYSKALNTTSYQYDSHGRLIGEIIDPTVSWTDNQGTEHTETGLNINKEYAYDTAGNVAAQTNARGFTTRYVHDKFGRLIYTIAELENDRGLVTENQYDDNGRLVSVIQYATTVSLVGLSDVITLAEAQSLVTGLATADDRLQQQVFDNDGRLIYNISPSGLVGENVYDGNGNIIQTISYSESIVAGTYTTVAQVQTALTTANDSLPEQNAWSVYDANSRALFNIDALGYLTANDYDNNGNLTRSIRYATAINTAILNDANADNRGQISALLPSLANAADQTTRYTYDNANRQVYKLDAQGYVTETRYDAAGRAEVTIAYAAPVSIASAAPSITEIAAQLPATPGAQDRVMITHHDAAGRVKSTVDAEGGVEQFSYDVAGNRTSYTNAVGSTWNYRYDGANRMVEERSPEVAVTQLDATLWQQGFEVDSSGLMVSADAANLNSAIVADGRLELHTRENATELWPTLSGDNIYDFQDRITFEAEINIGNSSTNRYAFYGIHNDPGWVIGSGSPTYRRYGVTVDGNIAYASYWDNGWHWDELGQVEDNKTYTIKVSTTDQGTTLQFYEAGASASTGYQHARTVSDWGQQVNTLIYTHAAPGASGSVVYFDNMRELMPQDRVLMSEAATLSDQVSHQSIVTQIEYSVMGNVTARVEAVGTANERRTEFAYDTMNRQVSVTYPEVGVYEYVDSNIDYASSRQETLQTLSSETYFDVFGNAVLGVDTAGNISYKVYDENNRLRYDIDANGYVTENRYDAFGNVTELVRYANAITLPIAAIDPLDPGMSEAEVQALLTVSGLDRTLVHEYDALNRVTRVEQPNITVAASLDAQGTVTTGTASPTTLNQYDAFGRVIKQSTLADGSRWLEKHMYYDRSGNLLGSVDAEGYVTIAEYDRAGNVTRTIEYAQAIDLAAVGLDLTSFSSVQAHIVANTAVSGVDSTTGFDRETVVSYDRLNRVVNETRMNVLVSDASVSNAGQDTYSASFAGSVVNLTSSYAYDALGNVTAATDTSGNTVYKFYDAMGRLTGETEVTRTQQRYGLTTHTLLFVDNPGDSSATIRWARPPIPGMNAELQVRAIGTTTWTSLSVTESGTSLTAVIGALPSDQYEYQLNYTRVGETQVYAAATGTINVNTGKASGSGLNSQQIAYYVSDDGDTLFLSGNTTGITGVDIGGTIYGVTSQGSGNYRVNLGSLARGNYTFTTVGAANNISGQVQKITGDLGGDFAIQTTDVEIQYEIQKQAIYTVQRVTKSGHPKRGYWGANSIKITVPSLEHLGAQNLRYEVVLEFSNVPGDRKTRTYKGALNGSTFKIKTPHAKYLNMYSHARLERFVSIKIKRGDETTATHQTRHWGLADIAENLPNATLFGSSLLDYSYTTTTTTYKNYDLVLEATGAVDRQQLEFINLPTNAQSAKFLYRPAGSNGDFIEKQLNKIGTGYFSIGNRDIPAGVYEYEIRVNGSETATVSGSDLVVGNGIDGFESVSSPELYHELEFSLGSLTATTAELAYRLKGSSTWLYRTLDSVSTSMFTTTSVGMSWGDYEYEIFLDGSATAAITESEFTVDNRDTSRITPLTSYQHDHFGNVVASTRYANSSSFGPDGSINVLEDGLRDQTTYTYYSSHGKAVQQQDAEGNSVFYSYDKRGNLAKQWQWVTTSGDANVPGNQMFTGTVFRHDAVGQRTETIEIAETMLFNGPSQPLSVYGRDYVQANTMVAYNAFGEMVSRGLGAGNEEYFHYDNAGRLWRSNTEEGVNKIYLYNVQGNRVQELSSQGRDLTAAQYDYASLNTTAGLTTDILKNSYRYDDLGRVIEHIGAGRVQNTVTYRPTTAATLDRWGNTVSIVDPSGIRANSFFNQTNQQIKQVQAVGAPVTVVDETGASSTVTPTTLTHYDSFGRAIGNVDANGGVRVTEYDEAGQSVGKIAADGGIQRFVFDSFGNEIEKIRFNGAESSTPFATLKIYDRNNRLVSEYKPGGGETAYTYDEASNRTSVKRLESIALNGDRRYETTLYIYDSRGNLVEEKLNGQIDIYAADGSLSSATANPNAVVHHYGYDLQNNKVLEQQYIDVTSELTSTSVFDYFGRISSRNDFGGGVYTYAYNNAGYLSNESVTRGSSSGSKAYAYYEDGMLNSITRGSTTDTYEYDLSGRVTREYGNNGNLYNNQYSYNALGHLINLTASSVDLSYGVDSNHHEYAANINYQYDANGNRRSVMGTEGYRDAYIEQTIIIDPVLGAPHTIPGDPINHAATTINTVDLWYTYDAENRVLISRGDLVAGAVQVKQEDGSMRYTYDKAGFRNEAYYHNGTNWITENHLYDADGNVLATTEGASALYTSERTYDLMGRVTSYTAYSSPGTKSEIHYTNYNDNGQIAEKLIYQINGSAQGALQAHLRYDYNSAGNISYDGTGALKYYTLETFGTGAVTNTYNYNYSYYSGAVTSTISASNTVPSSNTTTHNYDVFGNMTSVSDSDNNVLNQSFTYNAAGQIIHKTKGDTSLKHQYYYLHNGHTIGTGGQIDVTDFDYTTTPLSDISGVAQGPSSYAVRAGDTLQSIAMSVYGDSQRWYLIADANGVSSNADLTPGQTLIIPGEVHSVRNSASAFRSISSAEIIGDTTPGLEGPAIAAPIVYRLEENKSSAFIQIIAIIVAIVVTALTAGAMGPVAAAMLGNLASQTLLMATGEQESFSASSFIGAGISAAVGGMGGGVGSAAAGNAIGNIVTQRIAIAMGEQEEFSWGAVAGAAVSGAIGAAANIPQTVGFKYLMQRFTTNFASSVFSQIVENKVDGNDRKIDYARTALNSFGQAVGNSIAANMKHAQASDLIDESNSTLGTNFDKNNSAHVETVYRNRNTIKAGLNAAAARRTVGGANNEGNKGETGAVSTNSTAVANIQKQQSGPSTRQIQKGDSFWNIAKEQLGVAATDTEILRQTQLIMQHNEGINPNQLEIGSTINLPDTGTGETIADSTKLLYGAAHLDYLASKWKKGAANQGSDNVKATQGNENIIVPGNQVLLAGMGGSSGLMNKDFSGSQNRVGLFSPVNNDYSIDPVLDWIKGNDAARSVYEWFVGEDMGSAWQSIWKFVKDGDTTGWVKGHTGGLGEGQLVPPFVREAISKAIQSKNEFAPNAMENGMHAWHAGSNAALSKELGFLGAPIIFLAGVYHETPLDSKSFWDEQRNQGTINHILDSTTDIIANVFGMTVGYIVPGDGDIDIATYLGNFIPGPGDPDPDGDGITQRGYTGDPTDAWGTGQGYPTDDN